MTAIGDIHINADPNFVGFRPQIAAGKRFDLPGGYYIDAQAQVGTDLELFNGEKAIQPLLIGGVHCSCLPPRILFECMRKHTTT